VQSNRNPNSDHLNPKSIGCQGLRRHHIPGRHIRVGHDSVHPVQSARDLGVYVDGAMTMRAHINHVLSSCYGTLRQLRSIKRSLPSHALNTLVTSLIHSRLDYCNVVFAGLPACDVQRLQSILNTAIRLVAGSSRRDHVTSLLRDRHWLPVKQRVEYTSCVRLFIVVCTATHHPTWSTSSRRPLLQAPELV